MMRPALALLLSLVLAACASDSAEPYPEAAANAPEIEDQAPTTEVTGQLIGDDEMLQTGEFVDRYELLAREGQWIRVELLSGDFDPYLIVRSPTGEQTEVDDSQQGNLSATKAVVRAVESGEWLIAVTTYEPGESGNYTLTYEVLDERPADAKDGRQVTPSEEEDETTV